MRNKDLTDRILVIGAAISTLFIGGQIMLFVFGIVDQIKTRSEWAHLDDVYQWLQIPMGLMLIFVLAAVLVAIWRRVISRRRTLIGASSTVAGATVPRGKYACWSPLRSFSRERASLNAPRSRKRVAR